MFKSGRRAFLRNAAGFAALGFSGCSTSAFNIARRPLGGQKIRLAVTGVSGKGFSDWLTMLKTGKVEIVAFCDVDPKRAGEALARQEVKDSGFADALAKKPIYSDYRKMLDEVGPRVDAITVSIPDHMHGAVALRAMRQGINAYVQKPLVRTLAEARLFEQVARESGVVTQMGNQGSSVSGMRRCVEVLQSGVIGDVGEVHVWTNRPVWPQCPAAAAYVKERVSGDGIPESLDWEAWLGVDATRPYLHLYPADIEIHDPWGLGRAVYQPFSWRGFTDFGTGALGDMACHMMNLPFRGLELGALSEVECVGVDGGNLVMFPSASTVRMSFPGRVSAVRPGVRLAPVELYWYEGGRKPSADLMAKVIADKRFNGKMPESGCLAIGSRGVLFSGSDYGLDAMVALGGEKVAVDIARHEACKAVPETLPRRSEPSSNGHYVEFLDAIAGEGPVFAETGSRCYSDTSLSIPMTESVLVGCIAQRLPLQKLKWDSRAWRFDSSAADAMVRPAFRAGHGI